MGSRETGGEDRAAALCVRDCRESSVQAVVDGLPRRTREFCPQMNNQRRDPLVGVVICTYNKPEALRSALRIVNEQTYTRHAVVVADDSLAARLITGSSVMAIQERLHITAAQQITA
jgi:hypothetical protein